MSGNTARIEYLFTRYMQKTCTREELQELFECIAQPQNRQILEQLMEEQYAILQPLASAQDIDWEHVYRQVIQTTDDTIISLDKPQRFRWLQVAAAAVVVLTLTLGGYWLMDRLGKNKLAVNDKTGNTVHDVLPGGHKAVLTLADGKTIVLDSAQNGVLAQQGSSVVNKAKDGELKYESAIGNRQSAMVTYNMLSTPRGGQYHLVLPDGSKVWLNAASSIRYPVAFTENERRVEITGEAYFEVNKVIDMNGHKKTFVVAIPLPTSRGGGGGRSAGGEIEVLGTHFNVNGYEDEEVIKTTLLEGKVKVVNGESSKVNRESVILKPGEQAILAANSPLTIDHSPDIDQVMGWKNGVTSFKSADIKSIMRQVARWYNVDVVYEGVIPQRRFTGGVSRNANLSELLHLLEVSKVHFRLEGNKLIVMP